MAALRAAASRRACHVPTNSTVVRLSPVDTDQGVLSVQGSMMTSWQGYVRQHGQRKCTGRYLHGRWGDAQNAGSVTLFDTDRPFAAANLRLAALLRMTCFRR